MKGADLFSAIHVRLVEGSWGGQRKLNLAVPVYIWKVIRNVKSRRVGVSASMCVRVRALEEENIIYIYIFVCTLRPYLESLIRLETYDLGKLAFES